MKRTIAILLPLLVIVAGATLWVLNLETASQPPPPVPDLPELEGVDPEIAELCGELAAAARAQPGSAEARGELAMALYANGLRAPAATVYQQTIELDPLPAKWWYLLAIAQQRLGQPADALASIDQAIARDATYPPAYWRRGMWRLELNEVEAARVDFEQALQLDSQSLPAQVGLARLDLRDGSGEAAAQRLEGIMRLNVDPGTTAYVRHLLGMAYMRQGRAAEARIHQASATGQPPTWGDPWLRDVAPFRRGYRFRLQQAQAMLGTGEATYLQRAREQLEALRALRPDDVAMLNSLATAYQRERRYEEAISALHDALARHQGHAPSYLNLSFIQAERGLMNEAVAAAEAALAANQNFGPAHAHRGELAGLTNDWERAAEEFGLAVRCGDVTPRTILNHGWVLVKLERWEEAKGVFEHALVIYPGVPSGLVGLARTLAELGFLEDAWTMLRAVERTSPAEQTIGPTRQRLTELQSQAESEDG